MNKKKSFLAVLLCTALLFTGCGAKKDVEGQNVASSKEAVQETLVPSVVEDAPAGAEYYSADTFDYGEVPAYNGTPYVVIHGNIPYYTEADLTAESYEYYSDLDSLGRCGVCVASVGQDLMPTEKRGDISSVKPTGWHSVQYDFVDGKSLYNRCHLLGFQLTAENANERNLITGTRYMNVDGMLPFENMVADYVKETGNHVLYRVTPVFVGDNLIAAGVLMEAMSVEDQGEDLLYCVFCYNVQPGVVIDYATGESYESAGENAPAQETSTENDSSQVAVEETYILNTNTKKFHMPTCSSVNDMKESSKKEFTGSRDTVIAEGYEPCKSCNP